MKNFKLLYTSRLFKLLCIVFLFMLDSVHLAFAKELSITDDMVLIPGGVFNRGCNRFGPQHGAPEQKVHLDVFWIDKFEVTNKKFEKLFPDHFLRRSILSDCDNCPVSKLNWYEAAASYQFSFETGQLSQSDRILRRRK